MLIPELLPHICVLWREIALAPDKQQAWRVGSDPGEPEPVLSPGSPGVVEVGLQPSPPLVDLLEALVELLAHPPLPGEQLSSAVAGCTKGGRLQFHQYPFPSRTRPSVP